MEVVCGLFESFIGSVMETVLVEVVLWHILKFHRKCYTGDSVVVYFKVLMVVL